MDNERRLDEVLEKLDLLKHIFEPVHEEWVRLNAEVADVRLRIFDIENILLKGSNPLIQLVSSLDIKKDTLEKLRDDLNQLRIVTNDISMRMEALEKLEKTIHEISDIQSNLKEIKFKVNMLENHHEQSTQRSWAFWIMIIGAALGLIGGIIAATIQILPNIKK